MKKMLILALAVVMVTGGAAFMLNKKRADAAREFIAALSGDLSAESVKADFFGGGLEIRGLKGTFTGMEDMPMELDVRMLRLDGVNAGAGKTPGQAKLADRIQCEGFNVLFSGENGGPWGYSEYGAETLEINGLWGDLAAFSAASGKGRSAMEYIDAMLSLRFGASSLRKGTLKGAVTHMPDELGLSEDGKISYTVTMEDAEAEPHTMTDIGRTAMRGVEPVFGGGTRVSMKEIGMESGKMAEELYRTLLFDMDLSSFETPEEVLGLYASGYAMQGLAGKDMSLTLPNGEAMTMAGFGCTMVISGEEIHFALNADDAVLPAPFWTSLTNDPELYGSLLNDRSFSFTSKHDLRFAAAESDRVVITYDEDVSEKELGTWKNRASLFAMQAGGPLKALPGGVAGMALDKALFEIKDTGFIRLVYDLLGAEVSVLSGGAMSPRDAGDLLRMQQVAALTAYPLPENSPLAKLRGEFVTLLEKSGTLKVALDAGQPVPLLPLLISPDTWNQLPIESEYTPGQ